MTTGQIYEFINSFAPFETALDFDNVGLLVGDYRQEIRKIGVVLDITKQAALYAAQNGVDLIVSHHPVIFHPLKRLSSNSAAYILASNGISAICAHTNLDAASGGVNDTLAKTLGLANIRSLPDPETPGFPPLARIGDCPFEMTAAEFAKYVSKRLDTKVRAVLNSKTVKTAAVCGGAGENFIVPAFESGADALITADVRHHNLLLAKELDFCLIDAGHFETENIIVPILAERLRAFSGLETILIPQGSPSVYF